MTDVAEQTGDEAGAEDHEDGDAVRRRAEEDGAEQRQRGDDEDADPELDARKDDPVRPPASREPRDEERQEVDGEDVRKTDDRGAEKARHQEHGPPDRPYHER